MRRLNKTKAAQLKEEDWPAFKTSDELLQLGEISEEYYTTIPC